MYLPVVVNEKKTKKTQEMHVIHAHFVSSSCDFFCHETQKDFEEYPDRSLNEFIKGLSLKLLNKKSTIKRGHDLCIILV